jgi:hypothetical protein
MAAAHHVAEMDRGGRRFRVEQRDEEEAVHEEGADEIDLAVSATSLAIRC